MNIAWRMPTYTRLARNIQGTYYNNNKKETFCNDNCRVAKTLLESDQERGFCIIKTSTFWIRSIAMFTRISRNRQQRRMSPIPKSWAYHVLRVGLGMLYIVWRKIETGFDRVGGWAVSFQHFLWGFFFLSRWKIFKYCQELRGDLGNLYYYYSPSKSQHISSTNQGCSEDRLVPIQTEPRHANVIRKSNPGWLGRGIKGQTMFICILVLPTQNLQSAMTTLAVDGV